MLLLFYVLQHSLQHQCASEFGAYSQHSNLHPKKYFLPLKYLLPVWHGQVRYFQIWMRWNDRKVKWWARLQTQFCVWFWLLLPCMPHALNISVFLIKTNVNPPPLVLSDLVLPLMLQLRCSWHVVLFDVLRCQMKVKVKIQILDFLKVLLSYFFILDRWNSSYSKSTHAVKCTAHLVELHPLQSTMNWAWCKTRAQSRVKTELAFTVRPEKRTLTACHDNFMRRKYFNAVFE